MFEVGFSEIIVIVVVALIVIGPDKLPKLARTYGLLYGRVQRYISGVKQDIDRQVALDTMKKATADAQQKLLSMQSTLIDVHTEIEDMVLPPAATKPAPPVPVAEPVALK
ncbi:MULTISPECIES: Sec-independent protein translocase protein TatB [unclassified Methylophilus]|jgi:sec-independent protein translocase protein TatB|uniref:Sec-independent protein translocase protein TatB n=1 Tax=unclassified Methylophilus TaxID=2630143 RepID=UPI000EDF6BE2|nr:MULTISPECIES: Sec-independent protein translocase protein TatB [unclassified Methylophilus]MBF4992027.1 twin-arginine translocase subunit TatB [Methylophilus sp. QUAN]HCU85496.1 twin-arginine translocase subunit TatB [Methylophilus sp.]